MKGSPIAAQDTEESFVGEWSDEEEDEEEEVEEAEPEVGVYFSSETRP